LRIAPLVGSALPHLLLDHDVAGPSSADRWMGDDVAPTFPNEGRGEVVLAFLVIASPSKLRTTLKGQFGRRKTPEIGRASCRERVYVLV